MNRLFTLLQVFLEGAWDILRIPFPTTNIPIVALLFLPMIVSIAIALFRNIFGIGGFGQITDTINNFRAHQPKDNVKIYNMKRTPSKGIRGIK